MRQHYVGMDVHQASTSIAVMNGRGKLISESLIETKAQTIVDFLKGLSGEVLVTFEEGTQAAWLYDIIRPQVAELVVCNPHHNHLLKSGNKSDRVDARKLAQLLRAGMLQPVYHGEHGTRDPEGAGAQLRMSGCRYQPSEESDQSDLSRSGSAHERSSSLSGESARGVAAKD